MDFFPPDSPSYETLSTTVIGHTTIYFATMGQSSPSPFVEGSRSVPLSQPPTSSAVHQPEVPVASSSTSTSASHTAPRVSPAHKDATSSTTSGSQSESVAESPSAATSTDLKLSSSSGSPSLSVSVVTQMITESPSPSPSAQTQTVTATLTEGKIIAIALGAVLFVTFICLGIWLIRRRRVKQRGATEEARITAWHAGNPSLSQTAVDRSCRLRALLEGSRSDLELPPPPAYSERRMPIVCRVWRGKL